MNLSVIINKNLFKLFIFNLLFMLMLAIINVSVKAMAIPTNPKDFNGDVLMYNRPYHVYHIDNDFRGLGFDVDSSWDYVYSQGYFINQGTATTIIFKPADESEKLYIDINDKVYIINSDSHWPDYNYWDTPVFDNRIFLNKHNDARTFYVSSALNGLNTVRIDIDYRAIDIQSNKKKWLILNNNPPREGFNFRFIPAWNEEKYKIEAIYQYYNNSNFSFNIEPDKKGFRVGRTDTQSTASLKVYAINEFLKQTLIYDGAASNTTDLIHHLPGAIGYSVIYQDAYGTTREIFGINQPVPPLDTY